jgi:predicted DCC family thiol-disulfide oxidoreductase YuxK
MNSLLSKNLRILLATYLAIHFSMLLPYASELFSSQGTLQDISALPSYGFFPNPLFCFTTPQDATIFVVILLVLSVGLMFQASYRIAALLLWFGWASLLSRNPFIANPSIPYIGYLLLIIAVAPAKREKIVQLLRNSLWVLLALGYTISGLHKLGSPSWVDGSALRELLMNPLSRDTAVTHLMRDTPDVILSILTWSALALEIFFTPLVMFKRVTPYVWGAMIAMHLGILSVVSFADLTTGMIIVHLYVFNPEWLRVVKNEIKGARTTVFFDGECGMCNSFVQWVLQHDSRQEVLFAPLQGDYAKKTLPSGLTSDISTVVVRDRVGAISLRSDSIIAICREIDSLWLIFIVLSITPRFLRDLGYKLVARNRHKLFPKREACRLITPEERVRFLA